MTLNLPKQDDYDTFLSHIKAKEWNSAEDILKTHSLESVKTWPKFENFEIEIYFPISRTCHSIFIKCCRYELIDLELTNHHLSFFITFGTQDDRTWLASKVTPKIGKMLRRSGVSGLNLVEWACREKCDIEKMHFLRHLCDTEGVFVFPMDKYWTKFQYYEGEFTNQEYKMWWLDNVFTV
jgi:hypothetical protein